MCQLTNYGRRSRTETVNHETLPWREHAWAAPQHHLFKRPQSSQLRQKEEVGSFILLVLKSLPYGFVGGGTNALRSLKPKTTYPRKKANFFTILAWSLTQLREEVRKHFRSEIRSFTFQRSTINSTKINQSAEVLTIQTLLSIPRCRNMHVRGTMKTKQTFLNFQNLKDTDPQREEGGSTFDMYQHNSVIPPLGKYP